MPGVKKAVITAAGRGTRQFPATHTVQKELFPLVDVDGFTKPALQIIVEEALRAGLDEVCVIANPVNAEPIRRHFRGLSAEKVDELFQGKDWAERQSEQLREIGDRLTVVVQGQQEGYGHAVATAKEWVGREPFVQILGDHVYLSKRAANCTAQTLAVYEHYCKPVSSVARTPESIIGRFGTVAGTPVDAREAGVPQVYVIDRMREKPDAAYARECLHTHGLPPTEYLCYFDIHVFEPSLFDVLDHLIENDIRVNGEIQLASAQEVLYRNEKWLATEIDGARYDFGVPEGLIETQLALAVRSPYGSRLREM